MKNIQIPEELFFDLLKYFILTSDDEIISEEMHERIRIGLLKKLQAMADRELYTTYKTAPTEEEREKARQKYLDSKGIPQNFRW